MAYRIKELERVSGETERTIRYYVQLGLLPPPRRIGRLAWYDEHHLARLRQIRGLQEKGYRLEQVREKLARQVADTTIDAEAEATIRDLARMPRLRAGREFDALTPAMLVPALRVEPKEARSEIWRRVSITPDVELHVRGRKGRTIARLERLLRTALEEEAEAGRKGHFDD